MTSCWTLTLRSIVSTAFRRHSASKQRAGHQGGSTRGQRPAASANSWESVARNAALDVVCLLRGLSRAPDGVEETGIVDRDGGRAKPATTLTSRRWCPRKDHILTALHARPNSCRLSIRSRRDEAGAEVEVAQLLQPGEAAGAHRGLQPTAISELDLGREQLLDGLGRRRGAAVDALEDRLEGFEGARHPQVGQDLTQAGRVVIARSPFDTSRELRVDGQGPFSTTTTPGHTRILQIGRPRAPAGGPARRSKRTRGRLCVVPCTRTLVRRSNQAGR